MIILCWILLTVIFVIVPTLNDNIIRVLLGIPTILFIPGYVFIGALFPKKNDLDGIERIALSFGLSIAIVPLIGLGLNYTFGIRLVPILLSLTIFDVLMIFIAMIRREECGKEQFAIPDLKIKINDVINDIKKESRIERLLTIILIISMTIAVGMVIYAITVPKIGEKYTEFYILNATTEKADRYDTNLNPDGKYLVGVVNHEYDLVNYTVEAAIDKDILISKKLELKNNQTWENNITIIPAKKGNNLKLEFWLFKENNFTPYRELHLWVNSS